MKHVLYVAYWGLREPLGRALIQPAVERLSRRARIRLLTFDKVADLRDQTELAALRTRLTSFGITWKALRYHKRPTLPAKLVDLSLIHISEPTRH